MRHVKHQQGKHNRQCGTSGVYVSWRKEWWNENLYSIAPCYPATALLSKLHGCQLDEPPVFSANHQSNTLVSIFHHWLCMSMSICYVFLLEIKSLLLLKRTCKIACTILLWRMHYFVAMWYVMVSNSITTRRNLHRIWITRETSFVKWAPGPHFKKP